MALTATNNAFSAPAMNGQSVDHSQLDDIISELLGDSSMTTSRTLPQHGSLSSQEGNTRTLLSWESNAQGPRKSAAVTQQSRTHGPGLEAETTSVHKKEITRGGGSIGQSYSTMQESHRVESYGGSSGRAGIGSPISPINGSPLPSRLHSVPYKVGYENSNSAHQRSYSVDRSFGHDRSYSLDERDTAGERSFLDYSSDSDAMMSGWLSDKQSKLREMREQRMVTPKRTQQEKQMVAELENAQRLHQRKRAQSETDEAAIIEQIISRNADDSLATMTRMHDSYGSSSHNGELYPSSPERSLSLGRGGHASRSSNKGASYKQESFVFRATSPRGSRKVATPEPIRTATTDTKSEKSYYVSGLERPPFTTHQTKYVFSISPPVVSKPPPSPIVPQRTNASREAVVRSRSMTREWQGPPSRHGTLSNQRSDSSFDQLQSRSRTLSSSPPPLRNPHSLQQFTESPPPHLQTRLEPVRYSPHPQNNKPVTPSISYTYHQAKYQLGDKDEPDGVVEEPVVRQEAPVRNNVDRAGYQPKEEPITSGYDSTTESSFMEQSFLDPEPEEIEIEEISLQPIGIGMHNLEPVAPHPEGGRITPGPVVNAASIGPVQSVPIQGQPQVAQTIQKTVTQQSVQQSHMQSSSSGNRPITPGTPGDMPMLQQPNQMMQQPPNQMMQQPPNQMMQQPPNQMMQLQPNQQPMAFPSPGTSNTLPMQGQGHPADFRMEESSSKQHMQHQQIQGGQQTSQSTQQFRSQHQQQYSTAGGQQPMQSVGNQNGFMITDSGPPSSQQSTPLPLPVQGNNQSQHNTMQRQDPVNDDVINSIEAMMVNSAPPASQGNGLPAHQAALGGQQQNGFITQQQNQQTQQQLYSQSSKQYGGVGGMNGGVGGMSGNQDALTVDTSQRMLNTNSMGRSHSTGPASQSPGVQMNRNNMLNSAPITPGGMSYQSQNSPNFFMGHSRNGSISSAEGADFSQHTPRFVRDTSKYWYKPNISREEAISLLKDKEPGTFVVRDSNSFPGAYGLALKVAHVPPNVQAKPTDQPGHELVRHFLIEPTKKGVKLKGCSNEPVFGSLAQLVYQHSITPLALPCVLKLPDGQDDVDSGLQNDMPASPAQLLHQGAACNVLYITSKDMESLTGPEAVAKAVKDVVAQMSKQKTTVVHFKVSSQGITLTDNKRKLFFRRHYPVNTVTYCGMDPEDRRWTQPADVDSASVSQAMMFGFVARKQGSSSENQCHVFAEMDPSQPASAIVNFVSKVMIAQSKRT